MMTWRQVLTWDISTEPEVGDQVTVLFGLGWFHDTEVEHPDEVLMDPGTIVAIVDPQRGRSYNVRWPGGDTFWLMRTEFVVL